MTSDNILQHLNFLPAFLRDTTAALIIILIRRYGVDLEARISVDVEMEGESFALGIKVELSNNQAGVPEFSIDWGKGDFWNMKKREKIKNAIKKGLIPPLSDQVLKIIEEMKDK
mmetsp:Transcript_27864/g.38908  ORF Transcript_27864/g.38908 Transcript_27864/m.38908 type:complete len:114 (+) Transcript_27864:1205-1546(+)